MSERKALIFAFIAVLLIWAFAIVAWIWVIRHTWNH